MWLLIHVGIRVNITKMVQSFLHYRPMVNPLHLMMVPTYWWGDWGLGNYFTEGLDTGSKPHQSIFMQINTLGQQKTGSTLAQVMACCPTAPSHYLNQCWLNISKVCWHSSEGNFTADISATNHCNQLENYPSKIYIESLSGQWVKCKRPSWPIKCQSSIQKLDLHITVYRSTAGGQAPSGVRISISSSD